MSSNPSFRSELLVAVVVPARNAEPTLDRTLGSIRCQTHANLEIVVVDDASTDATARIVLDHAAQDPRVKLVRNSVCAGVAAARNRGAAETGAEYLAFLDADDVLTIDSIAVRLDALVGAGAGMAYCWSAVIDAQDRVLSIPARPTASGDVFEELLGGNFIGNGSAVICTREAMEAAGGFNEAFFKSGAQGCEDYAFYLAVARRLRVACVGRILVGYRQTPNNMSSDGHRMARSLRLVHENLLADRPDLAPLLSAVENDLRLHFAIRMIGSGRAAEGLRLLAGIGLALPHRLWVHGRRALTKGRSERLLAAGSAFPFSTPTGMPTRAAAFGTS